MVQDNRLVYMPEADYVGADSFVFRATDLGDLSVDGTASVTVEEADGYTRQQLRRFARKKCSQKPRPDWCSRLKDRYR